MRHFMQRRRRIYTHAGSPLQVKIAPAAAIATCLDIGPDCCWCTDRRLHTSGIAPGRHANIIIIIGGHYGCSTSQSTAA
jgi:hypothetical protein